MSETQWELLQQTKEPRLFLPVTNVKDDMLLDMVEIRDMWGNRLAHRGDIHKIIINTTFDTARKATQIVNFAKNRSAGG